MLIILLTGDNPVLVIDEGVLMAQAAMLAEEDPVAAFLTSDSFTTVVPDGVEVRSPRLYTYSTQAIDHKEISYIGSTITRVL